VVLKSRRACRTARRQIGARHRRHQLRGEPSEPTSEHDPTVVDLVDEISVWRSAERASGALLR
jgi:hypothetical protein